MNHIFKKTKNIFIFQVVCVFILASCNVFGPSRKKSNANYKKIEVADPVKYKAAKAKLNLANRHFARKNFPAAMKYTDESLGIYETWEGYYLKGAVLFQTGKTKKSINYFQKARNINPNDEQLLMTTATAYTSDGDLQEALSIYKQLQKINPGEPVYAFKTGTTWKNLQNYPEAYKELKKADTKKFRHLDQTYLHLGDVCIELKKYDESKEYFAKARKLNPKLRDAKSGSQSSDLARILDDGNAAFQQKNYTKARQEYNRARKLAPRSPAPLLLLGSLDLSLKHYKEATTSLTQAVKLDAKNPRGYSLLGSAHHNSGDFRQALNVYDQGLGIAPENFEMHNKKGLVYRSRLEYPAAISSFYKALQINPKYLQARYNLALTLLDNKRYSDARREFKLASSQDPKNKDYIQAIKLVDMYEFLDRGDRYFQTRKFDKAAIEYNKAKKVINDKPIVYNSLGRLLFTGRKYNGAEKNFNKSLELDKNNIAAMQGLLRIYSRKKNNKKSAAIIARIKNLTKNDITAAVTIGRIKEDDGKLKEAEKYYLDLLKQNPDEQIIKRRLGYVYYKQGQAMNKKGQFKNASTLFLKAKDYNDQIPQLPEALKVVEENIKFARLLPKLKRAENLFDQARYKEALPLLDEVYQKLKRPMILVKISNCHIALGNEEKGIQLLKDANSSGSVDLPIVEAIYTHLLNKGKIDEAKKGFNEIVAIHKQAHFSWYKLGVIELMQKKYGSANEKFSLAILHKPDFSVAYIARGVVYYEQEKKGKAQEEFKKAIKYTTSRNLGNYNIGIVHFNDGLMDKAEEVFKSLIKNNPQMVDSRYQLSYIYFEKDKLDEAKTQLQDALKIKKEPRLYHGLSRIYEKAWLAQKSPENIANLKGSYQEIISRYPDSKYAEESRAKLLRIVPDGQVLQPYSKLQDYPFQANIFNGDLLYFSGNNLVSVRSSTKKKNWEITFNVKPQKMITDLFVHVFLKNEFWIINSTNGNVLKKIKVPPGSYQMTGGYNKIGIVSNAKNPVLTVYDQFGNQTAVSTPLAKSRYFYHNGRFYQLLPTAKQLAVTLLSEGLKPEKNKQLKFNRYNARPKIKTVKDKIYIYVPGSSLITLDSMLEKQVRIELPKTAVDLFVTPNEEIIIPSATFLSRFSADGKYSGKIKLVQTMVSRKSIRLLEKSFLYIGRDRKIYKQSYDGKKEWALKTQNPPRFARNSQAWSLYY